MVEIFIVLMLMMTGLFCLAYFTKNEIIWGVVALLNVFMLLDKVPGVSLYVIGINILFFLLAGFFMILDLVDKYSLSTRC